MRVDKSVAREFYAWCLDRPTLVLAFDSPLNISKRKWKSVVEEMNWRGASFRWEKRKLVGSAPAHVMSLFMRHLWTGETRANIPVARFGKANNAILSFS